MAAYRAARRPRGFVLIEALVAMLIISVGLLGIFLTQRTVLSNAGEARMRSEAAAIGLRKLESLRNVISATQYDNVVTWSGYDSAADPNSVYRITYTVTPDAALSQKVVQLTVAWADSTGAKSLDLNSVLAWDDTLLSGATTTASSSTPVGPSGSAKRGDYSTVSLQGLSQRSDGTYIKVGEDNTSKLLDSTGKVVLTLASVNNVAQSFVNITGRIYFDQNAGNNAIPPSGNVQVRLSSEGQCFYNSANASLVSVSSGSNSYKYFTYSCYVGPGWYGNVGVTVDDSVNGAAGSPTICVGDPTFNSGTSNGTLISAHPVEAATRSYRGFKASGGTYLTTGVSGGTGYPSSGLPVPASYPSYYGAGVSTAFNHHFLITNISGNGNNNNTASCKNKMTGGEFTANAGQYFCISPDNDTASADACPSIWPNFESQVAAGAGTVNYTLTVTGATGGTVASDTGGVSCGSTCTGSYASGTSVTLTATPQTGYTFSGWGGACSGTGTCALTMSSNQSVTASFGSGNTTYSLATTVSGSGSVSSSPSGISCSSGTCSASFQSGATVVLSATAASGSTFTGWGGACSGTGSCTVSMSQARTVTATFATSAPTTYALTVSKSGSGTVTSSPAGLSCGTTCTASFSTGATVTLTASASSGYQFTGWGGACSGTGTCTVTMSAAQSVTATFGALCTTNVKGSATDKYSTVTIDSPANAGSCSLTGGSKNYSCDLSTLSGTVVTLRNHSTTSPSSFTDKTMTVTASCNNQTNVNFP